MAIAISLGDLDSSAQQAVLGALGVGSQFGVLLPFSCKYESEADRMGLNFYGACVFWSNRGTKNLATNGECYRGQKTI